MRNNRKSRSQLGVVLAGLAMAAGTSFGAALYWDADGTGSTATGGSGPWDITNSTWRLSSGTGTLQPWANGTNGNSAYLRGTVGTLTLADNITIAYMEASNGYVINGDGGGLYKVTFDSTSKVGGDGGTYALFYNNSGTLTVNAPVVLAGAFNFDFRSSATLNGVVSDNGSTAGFLANGGTITLNNAKHVLRGLQRLWHLDHRP